MKVPWNEAAAFEYHTSIEDMRYAGISEARIYLSLSIFESESTENRSENKSEGEKSGRSKISSLTRLARSLVGQSYQACSSLGGEKAPNTQAIAVVYVRVQAMQVVVPYNTYHILSYHTSCIDPIMLPPYNVCILKLSAHMRFADCLLYLYTSHDTPFLQILPSTLHCPLPAVLADQAMQNRPQNTHHC